MNTDPGPTGGMDGGRLLVHVPGHDGADRSSELLRRLGADLGRDGQPGEPSLAAGLAWAVGPAA